MWILKHESKYLTISVHFKKVLWHFKKPLFWPPLRGFQFYFKHPIGFLKSMFRNPHWFHKPSEITISDSMMTVYWQGYC